MDIGEDGEFVCVYLITTGRRRMTIRIKEREECELMRVDRRRGGKWKVKRRMPIARLLLFVIPSFLLLGHGRDVIES